MDSSNKTPIRCAYAPRIVTTRSNCSSYRAVRTI
nr:MAG TPA: hypothetical protein [Caudoviricetes sp.]